MPERILDLYAEYRVSTNGLLPPKAKNGLIDGLAHHGLRHLEAVAKRSMVDRILAGPPYTICEIRDILDYCESDVAALDRLLPAMLNRIDLLRALLRGRSAAATARMEHIGVPLDTELHDRLQNHWPDLQDRMIATVDADYRVFEGRTFKTCRFIDYLDRHKRPWPIYENGTLDLRDKTFRDMAMIYPDLDNLRQLRHALSGLRLNSLTAGSDGYSRCELRPFTSKTGRYQPSNSKFMFGPSSWLRGLIKPPPGWAVSYIDWSQQEFGIAASLSGDPKMLDAYLSGDSYLEFAKQAGAVPTNATKHTHSRERELYKQCVLAVQYLMGYRSLAVRLNQHLLVAKSLLEAHHTLGVVAKRLLCRISDFATLRPRCR